MIGNLAASVYPSVTALSLLNTACSSLDLGGHSSVTFEVCCRCWDLNACSFPPR